MNKSYCKAAFNHIYSDSKDCYKLCCHARVNPTIAKYKPNDTAPFDFFLSEEMEEIRNRMIAGDPIDGCEPCYEAEAQGFKSYRQSFGADVDQLTVQNVDLKLRIWGSACNLSCYMCLPLNSSTRRNELKKIDTDIFPKNLSEAIPVRKENYDRIAQNILDNIQYVSYIKIIGGEPLQLPRHFEFLKAIPDEHKKHIWVSYDTNLTTLSFKGHSVYDVIGKFKKVTFSVSCDHFGDKLAWIRYPINVKQFEANLRKMHEHIYSIQITASLLNIMDLKEIVGYYTNEFDLRVWIPSVVVAPETLSIRQLSDEDKYRVRTMYDHNDPLYEHIWPELEKPCKAELQPKFEKYMRDLDRLRGTDSRKIFGKQFYENIDA